MPTIHSLHIYPIKGMRGISLPSAKLQPEGFEYDRRWMLVDDSGTFISQRTHPEMTMFIPSIAGDILSVEYKGTRIEIPINTVTQDHIDVSVFDDDMRATVVSAAASRWFSDQMGASLQLVKVSQVTNRVKNCAKYTDGSPTETVVSFADGYPYLILSTASMDQLNSKMDVKLDIDRFRANIVVDTDNPHDEDTWKSIQIGGSADDSHQAMCKMPSADYRSADWSEGQATEYSLS